MLMRQCGSLGAVISAFGLILLISTGQGLAQDRRQECSAKYKAAKVDGSLGGLTWPQFFSRCMAELKAASEAPAEAKPEQAVVEPVNPLKPVPPAQPAEIEPVPPVPSVAEAPAVPAKPSSTPTEALTAVPSKPESASPSRPTPAPAETTSQMKPTVPQKAAPVTPTVAAPAPPPEAPSAKEASPASREPVFPTAIAPAYAKDKPSIARRKTCQDQYNANKATDSNGGLKWIEKGGGYMSECNKRLKGES